MPPANQPVGAWVVESLACYDQWMGSDADDQAFNCFTNSMERLRDAIAIAIDKETADA